MECHQILRKGRCDLRAEFRPSCCSTVGGQGPESYPEVSSAPPPPNPGSWCRQPQASCPVCTSHVHKAPGDSLLPPVCQRPVAGRKGAHHPEPGELGATLSQHSEGFYGSTTCPPSPCPEATLCTEASFSLKF